MMFTTKKKAAAQRNYAAAEARSEGYRAGFQTGVLSGQTGLRQVAVEDIDLDITALEDELAGVTGKGTGAKRAYLKGQLDALKVARRTVETLQA